MLESSKTIPLKAIDTMQVEDWGLVDYSQATQRQLDLVDRVARELARETLIFCQHPPVVTLGRATKPEDVFGWTGPSLEVSRGGRATYHGPSQIVVYPIIDLSHRSRDIHHYLRSLENAIVQTLAEFGIQSVSNPEGLSDDPELQATGVWVGRRKIASIGIAVKKWISYHGLALNVFDDPHAFAGIKPCGFQPGTPISMQEILGRPPDMQNVKAVLAESLVRHLQAGAGV